MACDSLKLLCLFSNIVNPLAPACKCLTLCAWLGTFRDLSRPVGALSLERLLEYRRRYEALVDSTIPKFMYGHHYSTAVGTVIHYLLRMYPFTELHVQYQVRSQSPFVQGGGGVVSGCFLLVCGQTPRACNIIAASLSRY